MSFHPFYCCYLIRSLKEGHQNKVYVGSTPNPIRRLRQHNGEITQGAYKTRKHRPWEVVMIIYGFPTKAHALQFEWAWQKPLQSRHTKRNNIQSITLETLQTTRQQNLMLTKFWAAQLILDMMPFCLLPLKTRFLSIQTQSLFFENYQLPSQMSSSVGAIETLIRSILENDRQCVEKLQTISDNINKTCDICFDDIQQSQYLVCTDCCRMVCHVLCLAKEWTKEFELVPLQGECLKCKKLWSWGDLIRISKLKEVSLLGESSYKGSDEDSDEDSDEGSDENLDEGLDGVSDASSSSSVINLTDQN